MYNFCIRTNIGLFICLSGRGILWSGYSAATESERWAGVSEGWCASYFRNAGEKKILIGTFRLDKDVRFKRSKAIIKYTTGHCCSKIYLLLAPLPFVLLFSFSTLSFSCQRWKENLISIRLNCGGQHYQFKRPGDLTAPTPWWLITSQLRWAFHSPLSLPAALEVVVLAGGNTW